MLAKTDRQTGLMLGRTLSDCLFLREAAKRSSARGDLLFTLACCRRVAYLDLPVALTRLLEVLERSAEGDAGPAQVKAGVTAAERALRPTVRKAGVTAPCAVRDAGWAILAAARFQAAAPGHYRTPALQNVLALCWRAEATDSVRLDDVLPSRGRCARRRRLRTAWLELIDDVLPEPGTAAFGDPGGRSPLTETMAEAAYAGHDFTALPVLADALEDAGCANGPLLEHLRRHSGHYRGCWALEAVRTRSARVAGSCGAGNRV